MQTQIFVVPEVAEAYAESDYFREVAENPLFSWKNLHKKGKSTNYTTLGVVTYHKVESVHTTTFSFPDFQFYLHNERKNTSKIFESVTGTWKFVKHSPQCSQVNW